MALVYQHIRKVDNVCFYVGISRNKNRPKCKIRRSKEWKEEVKIHEYYISIYKEDITLEEANLLEQELILKYGRRNIGTGPLVNKTAGGKGTKGFKLSEEHRKKISEANKGKKLGINNPMYGKNPYADKPHPHSRKIIDTMTGIIYGSVLEVSRLSKIPRTTLMRWLDNNNLNKTNYKYL